MLKHLAPKFGNFDVVAMHIDYANRPESRAEAAFVEDWCRRHGRGVGGKRGGKGEACFSIKT